LVEVDTAKNQIPLHQKEPPMELWLLPKEEIYLTFKMVNGSGWLTSHRLILCEHESGHLEGHTPEFYALKDFKKTVLDKQSLTVEFRHQQAKIQAPINAPQNMLPEIKAYIEKASKILKQS
jgi:hypothetical protein